MSDLPADFNGKTFFLLNKWSNMALDLNDGSNRNGTPVNLYRLDARRENQAWVFNKIGDNLWTICNEYSKTYLEIDSGSTNDKARAQCWDRSNDQDAKRNQQWSIFKHPQEMDRYTLSFKNDRAGTMLTLYNGDRGESAAAIGYHNDGMPGMFWAPILKQ